MSSEVGTGHVSIVPVMTGFRKRVSNEVKQAGADGARGFNRAFSGVGRKLGNTVGQETKRGFAAATAGMGGEGVKRLSADVAKAARQVSRARLTQQDAAGKVRVAEARLAETMDRFPEGSAQVVAAEERLEAARRREQAATETLTQATKALKQAQDDLSKVQSAADKSAGGLGERLRNLRKRFAEGYAEGSKGVEKTNDLVRATGRLSRSLAGDAVSAISGYTRFLADSAVTAVRASRGFQVVTGAASAVAGGFRRFGTAVANGAKAAGTAVFRLMGPLGPFVQTVGSNMASGMRSGMGFVLQAASAGMGAVVSKVGALAGRMRDAVVQSARAAAGILQASFAAASAAIVANMGGAVSRVDMLNNYPKVMRNLGYSTEEAQASISALDKGISGLPTALDEIASTTQRLAPLTDGLSEATDLSLALNNALLAGGKGGAEAARALNQYTQMLGKGEVDLQSWRTLQEVMPGQLNQIAKALLGPTANSQDLYDALKGGEVGFDDFNAAILRLNNEGLAGYASFAQQAKDATAGIGTAWSNVGTAIRRNIAKVIDAIGADKITGALKSITGVIDVIGSKVAGLVGGINLSGFSGQFALLAPLVGGVLGALGPLLAKLPFIGGSFAALTGPVGLFVGALLAIVHASPGLRNALELGLSVILAELGRVFEALRPSIELFGEILGKVASIVGGLLTAALQAILPTIVMLIGIVGDIAGQLIPMLIPVLLIIGRVIAELTPILARIISTILPPLVDLVQALIPIAMQIVDVILQVVAALIPLLVPLGQLVAAILPPLIALFQAVLPPVIAFAQQIIGFLIPIIQGLVAMLQGLINFVTGVFTGNWDQAWQGLSTMFSGFVDTIRGLINGSLRLVLEAIPNMVKGIFSGASSWLLNAGRAIIQGLVDGFRSAFGWVRDTLGELTAMIPNLKGPMSVDKVLLVDNAHAIMGGFADTLEKDQRPIKRNLQRFTSDLAETGPNTAWNTLAAAGQAVMMLPDGLVVKIGEREFDAYWEEKQVRFEKRRG